jgi:hypothetical protein
MIAWERLGIGGLWQGYLSGRLSPSAVLDDAPAGIATLANRKSRIMRRRVATHNTRANAPVTRFRVLCGFGA